MNDYECVGFLINNRGNRFKVFWSPTFHRIWVEGTDIGSKASWREDAMDVALNWWTWNKDKRPYCL